MCFCWEQLPTALSCQISKQSGAGLKMIFRCSSAKLHYNHNWAESTVLSASWSPLECFLTSPLMQLGWWLRLQRLCVSPNEVYSQSQKKIKDAAAATATSAALIRLAPGQVGAIHMRSCLKLWSTFLLCDAFCEMSSFFLVAAVYLKPPSKLVKKVGVNFALLNDSSINYDTIILVWFKTQSCGGRGISILHSVLRPGNVPVVFYKVR